MMRIFLDGENSENVQNGQNVQNDQNEENDDVMLQNDEEAQRRVIEHEKLLNRIYLFEEKKKIHNREFLEDIQKRKKEER